MSLIFQKHENGVITIDAGYIRQGFAASHLILERGHAVFVETGTSHSVRAVSYTHLTLPTNREV